MICGGTNMKQALSFPGLGLEFTLDRVAFYMPAFLGGCRYSGTA
jgi:hypothetical protein